MSLPRKTFGGLKFFIDRPKGTVKEWPQPDGTVRRFEYPCDYGLFQGGLLGEDEEGLDAFVGDDPNGHLESFQKLRREGSKLVPDETKFLLGVTDAEREAIYRLYGLEVNARRVYDNVDQLGEALKKFEPKRAMKKTAAPWSQSDVTVFRAGQAPSGVNWQDVRAKAKATNPWPEFVAPYQTSHAAGVGAGAGGALGAALGYGVGRLLKRPGAGAAIGGAAGAALGSAGSAAMQSQRNTDWEHTANRASDNANGVMLGHQYAHPTADGVTYAGELSPDVQQGLRGPMDVANRLATPWWKPRGSEVEQARLTHVTAAQAQQHAKSAAYLYGVKLAGIAEAFTALGRFPSSFQGSDHTEAEILKAQIETPALFATQPNLKAMQMASDPYGMGMMGGGMGGGMAPPVHHRHRRHHH